MLISILIKIKNKINKQFNFKFGLEIIHYVLKIINDFKSQVKSGKQNYFFKLIEKLDLSFRTVRLLPCVRCPRTGNPSM